MLMFSRTGEFLSAKGWSPGWPLGSVVVLVATATLAVVIYSFVTRKEKSDQGPPSITRSMLALLLVGGLVILAGASFAAPFDAQTRNLLLGGVVASAASAVAFYFAARSADNARRDVLNAAFGTETVPKLEGLTVRGAKAEMSHVSLSLKLPRPEPNDAAKVMTQNPLAGTSVQRGTVVEITV
jgi:hypothetical protein